MSGAHEDLLKTAHTDALIGGRLRGGYGLDVADIFAGLPHDVGPVTAAAFPGSPGRIREGDARFSQPADNSRVEAIIGGGDESDGYEARPALAAVCGIGSKSLRKVSL